MRRRRGGRDGWLDRVVGILLGVVLGIGVVTAFVFLGSEETIDAPRISGVERDTRGLRGGLPLPEPLPLVRIEGGAPPAGGPAQIDAVRGARVRFRVESDVTLALEVPGYGIREEVPAGASRVSFRAIRAGQFPIVVADSHISVARLRVARGP